MKSKLLIAALFITLFLGSVVIAQDMQLTGDFQKAYISGTVTAGGKPVDGAEVTAMSDTGHARTVTASNGNYALGVGAGQWNISVSKPGYSNPEPISANVGADQVKGNVNFDLKISRAYIEGKVIHEDGKPFPYAVVLAMPGSMFDNDRGDEDKDNKAQVAQTICDKTGNFKLQVIPGKYSISAFYPGYKMSDKNPRQDMPAEMKQAMQYMPENMKGKMMSMLLGVPVEVKENETKSGLVLILDIDPSKPITGKSGSGSDSDSKVDTYPNILVGRACLTPNNVLHWTRKTGQKEDYAEYMVARSTEPFEKKGADYKTFPAYFGSPKNGYFSFTDSTAKSGVVYYYGVYEVGTKGAGPMSNIVMIKTQ